MRIKSYSISDFAKEFDITTRAIRFYEDQCLLSPKREGRTRVYSDRDRVRLRLILRGKRLGFSLSEIKELFNLYDSAPGEAGQLQYLLEKIADRRAHLIQQQQDIKIVLGEMESVESRAREALKIALE